METMDFEFMKAVSELIEKAEDEAKKQIELLNDDIKSFVKETMYPVIQSYAGCLATAEDYDNIDTLKKDWNDFISYYYKEEDY